MMKIPCSCQKRRTKWIHLKLSKLGKAVTASEENCAEIQKANIKYEDLDLGMRGLSNVLEKMPY